VSAEDSRSKENLCDGLELHPPLTRDFLDPIPGSGGDAQVLQQSLKPAGEDRSFGPEGLHLVSISVHLLGLGITRGRVLFIGLVFRVMTPPVAAAPQPVSPEPLGSQEPPALSQKVPLLVMPLVVRRAGTLGATTHSEVPAARRVDDRCSCVRCGGYEPSIIWKEKSMRQ
jgi:hypothetical protein